MITAWQAHANLSIISESTNNCEGQVEREKGRKQHKRSKKIQKIMECLAKAQSGGYEKTHLQFEGGAMQKDNFITILANEGIETRNHVARSLNFLEKREDITIANNMIEMIGPLTNSD
jgi:hypothetical protein